MGTLVRPKVFPSWTLNTLVLFQLLRRKKNIYLAHVSVAGIYLATAFTSIMVNHPNTDLQVGKCFGWESLFFDPITYNRIIFCLKTFKISWVFISLAWHISAPACFHNSSCKNGYSDLYSTHYYKLFIHESNYFGIVVVFFQTWMMNYLPFNIFQFWQRNYWNISIAFEKIEQAGAELGQAQVKLDVIVVIVVEVIV